MPIAIAFYAVMGGFAYGINGTAIRTMKLLGIVKPEVIDHIRTFSINDISDKSKADGIAKLLACVQAGWVLLQCLAREIQGLPITPLESNTVAHVLNAVVMYSLWWQKPVDVARPSIWGTPGLSSTTRTENYANTTRYTAVPTTQ